MSRLVNKSIKKSKTEKLLQLANKAVEEADRKHKQKEAEILRLQALELEKIKEIRALQLAEQQAKMKKEKEEKNEVDKVVEFELKDKSPLEEEGDKEPIPHEIIEEPDEKIILLTARAVKKAEGRQLESFYKVCKFDKKKHNKINDIDYELLIVPVTNKDGRDFWSKNLKFVESNENVTVVYLSKTGKKIKDIDNIKKQFSCSFVRKRLPKEKENKFLYTLELFSDHISKLTSSCLPVLKIFLDSR
jgi:hypothetical protein